MESSAAFERYCRRKRRERKQQERSFEKIFIGMENALSFLDGDNRIVVIHGPEGCGKTELVRKFASFERTKHCIWIDSKSKASILEDFEILAFKTLLLEPENCRGAPKNTNDVSTTVKKVHDYLGEDTLLVFDGLENFEDLRCLVAGETDMPISMLEPLFKKILITTQLEEFTFHGAVLPLQGFTLIESINLILSEIPNASRGDAHELSISCQFNPRRILRKIEGIKSSISKRYRTYPIEFNND